MFNKRFISNSISVTLISDYILLNIPHIRFQLLTNALLPVALNLPQQIETGPAPLAWKQLQSGVLARMDSQVTIPHKRSVALGTRVRQRLIALMDQLFVPIPVRRLAVTLATAVPTNRRGQAAVAKGMLLEQRFVVESRRTFRAPPPPDVIVHVQVGLHVVHRNLLAANVTNRPFISLPSGISVVANLVRGKGNFSPENPRTLVTRHLLLVTATSHVVITCGLDLESHPARLAGELGTLILLCVGGSNFRMGGDHVFRYGPVGGVVEKATFDATLKELNCGRRRNAVVVDERRNVLLDGEALLGAEVAVGDLESDFFCNFIDDFKF